MANWLLVVDKHETRRRVYAESLRATIAPIAGLKVASRDGDGWSAVWAAAKSAPVDVHADATGGGMVWGEARNAHGDLQSAVAIRRAWQDGAAAQWDGFYAAAIVEDSGQTLVVGTDLLGVFPVYYWSAEKDVVLVGTSPELFRTHPLFRIEFNIAGLIGILLSNGLVGGEALWRHVHRLNAGRRLRVQGNRVWEDEGYQVPTTPSALDLPLAGHVTQLDASVAAAVSRHAPSDRAYSLLLSGGLDSRLLAGYLANQNAQVEALTFGQPSDIEMRCARSVASALGFRHHIAEVPEVAYPDAACKLAKWELLAAGFSGLPEWGMHDAIGALPDRVVVGHIFDGIVGGIHIDWAYDSNTRRMGFDQLLPTVIRWGIEPEILKSSLLMPEARGLVDEVMWRLREEYDGAAAEEPYRAWLFDLRHRQRLHVGSALWTFSFASWPVAPFLDRDVMAVSAALPCSSLAHRRAQTELLVQRFPELASLPIDRNSHDMLPVLPRTTDYAKQVAAGWTMWLEGCVRRTLRQPMPERVYYRRLYDINGLGWKAVRQLANPLREHLHPVFDPAALDSLLPKPDTPGNEHKSLEDMSSARILLGLLLCSQPVTKMQL